MKTKTLIFFIDAVRPDYINKKDTPFLFKLKKEKTYLDMISQLGYSSGIHPSIWKSMYQEKHEHFLVYSRSKKKSDFAWMKMLKFIPGKIRKIFIASLKAPFYWSKNKNMFPKWYIKKILPIPASMDPNQAKYFETNKKVYEPDFFNILKKNKISYSSQPDGNHKIYGKGVPIPKWHLTNKDIDYYFSYETDPIGHYYGPISKEMKNRMNLIDKQIKKLYQKALKEHSKLNLFVFSDHGMVEIKGTVDIQKIMKKSKLKLIKDYIVFYDSTMVRFWVKNKKIENEIIDILSKTNNLTHLDKKLKTKYKIRFKTRKWGDLMFIVDPGYRIFPDYFAPIKFNTKGMHGYWPEHQDSKGIFITNAFKTNKKKINIIDLMPTMFKAIGLKKLIPKKIDGKSIF